MWDWRWGWWEYWGSIWGAIECTTACIEGVGTEEMVVWERGKEGAIN